MQLAAQPRKLMEEFASGKPDLQVRSILNQLTPKTLKFKDTTI